MFVTVQTLLTLADRACYLLFEPDAGQSEMVPKRRKSAKYLGAVDKILAALDKLPKGKALRITLSKRQKEGVRAALYRAAQQSGRKISTSTEDEFLYVWNCRVE
jgi:hypothetical protein